MFPVFFLTLREGIEAALIIGIILAYLNRTDRQEQVPMVWWGLGAAVLTCGALGLGIIQVLGNLEKNTMRIFEGVACLLAAVILTFVIVWMHNNAQHLGSQLRAAVDSAAERKQSWALAGLVFVTVGREGLETILILPGMSREASFLSVAAGVVLGLGLAVVIGVLLHKGSRVLDLQKFFKITGILLIFFAAGLVAYGVHELQDAGQFPIVMKDVWDINHVLNDKEGVGLLLKSLFGYNGNPEIIELVAYLGYLVISLVLFLKPPASKASQAA
jgi:high-affinity iron transporter